VTMDPEQEAAEREELATAEDLGDFCDDDLGDVEAEASNDCAQEIATLVSAIGIVDESGSRPFIRGEYCYAAVARLEYLLRSEYLRNRRVRDSAEDSDRDNNEMFAKCGEFMVLSKKLVPCFQSLMEDVIRFGLHDDKSRPLLRISQCLMKMFVRFTFPLTADAEQTEGYYIEYNKYHRFIEYQQSAKKALIDNAVLHHVVILMSDCGLELEPEERSEAQTDSLELILCLFKNLLSIPGALHHDDFVQDRAIMALVEEKVMDIVIELSRNIAEETDKIQYLLMDVFYEFFRIEDADSMFSATNPRAAGSDASSANDSLLEQFQREKAQRKSKLKRTRHNKWGGLSRVRGLSGQSRVQSLGSNQMANENMHDRRKQAKLRPVKERKKRTYLGPKVPAALIYVADRLLDRAFTPLMDVMMEKLSGRPEFELTQSSDCNKWFHVISLFLHFHRLRSRQLSAQNAKRDKLDFKALKWYSPSSIACVLKERLVHFVLSRCESLFESRKFKHLKLDWSKLEEALHVYKEIVRALYSMAQYGSDAVKSQGLSLFAFIFRDHRGPQLINDMIREYRAHQNTKLCLSYCIEAVFYTLSLIDTMRAQGNALKVATKKKRKKKKKKTAPRPPPPATEQPLEEGGLEMKLEDDAVEVAGMEIHDDLEDEESEDDFELMDQDFDFESFVRSYAANKVVAQYMYILEDWRLNSAKLNSYIVTLLHKLAFELDYAPLLFQLSYFLLFDEMLNDKVMAKDKSFNVVRKFAVKIVREFFRRAPSNPVLFSEILFFKTQDAVDDINAPGSARRTMTAKEERLKMAAERRAQRRNANDRLDDEDLDEEEDEFDGDGDAVGTVPWTEAEDDLLRSYYGTYCQQSNVVQILQDFLENEVQSERSQSEIQHHLKVLGLWKGPSRRRNGGRNEPKSRVKPMELSRAQRRSIIFHSVHRASYRQQLGDQDKDENGDGDEEKGDDAEREYVEDKVNRKCFEWLQSKVDGLRDLIDDAIAVSSEVLLDDVAIVPVDGHGFSVMDNHFVGDLLSKLGFLAPTKYTGTCWWRIPREFKTSDISMMTELMDEALKLPLNADLRALCGANAFSREIGAFGDDQGVEDEEVRVRSQQIMESAESGQRGRGKEEASGSEEEMEFGALSTVEAVNEGAESTKKKKQKKRKSERRKRKKSERRDGDRKSSKKRKSRKRKRAEPESEGEDDGLGGDFEVKRRRLTVNADAGGDEEDGDDFFGDVGGDDSDDQNGNDNVNVDGAQKENEHDEDMDSAPAINTSQIQKFRSLSLGENQNVLNAVAAETSEAEPEPIPKQSAAQKPRRRFVSDSDSD